MKPQQKPAAELHRGDRIPGSQYYREFCGRCGTPMRVPLSAIESNLSGQCERCDPRPLATTAATEDDSNPGIENAVRALEDQFC